MAKIGGMDFNYRLDNNDDEFEKKLDDFLSEIKKKILQDRDERIKNGGFSDEDDDHEEGDDVFCACPNCSSEVTYESFEEFFKNAPYGKIAYSSFTMEGIKFMAKLWYNPDDAEDCFVVLERFDPLSEKSEENLLLSLENELKQAIEVEDYNKSIELREKINKLKN